MEKKTPLTAVERQRADELYRQVTGLLSETQPPATMTTLEMLCYLLETGVICHIGHGCYCEFLDNLADDFPLPIWDQQAVMDYVTDYVGESAEDSEKEVRHHAR